MVMGSPAIAVGVGLEFHVLCGRSRPSGVRKTQIPQATARSEFAEMHDCDSVHQISLQLETERNSHTIAFDNLDRPSHMIGMHDDIVT